jgi:tripartite-type tricarboxylate transporter receptor subunit TctC
MKHLHSITRRLVLHASLAAAMTAAATFAGAASFPDKPVTLIVPYPAGGSVDFVARALQPQLQEALGQPVIIENRGGASAMIGSAYVAKSQPDGYTLLLGGLQPHAMNAAVIKNMLYDPLKDFTPIIETTRANWIIAANPATGIRTPADLVRVAKEKPGQLTYASSGVGSAAHLAFSLLDSELGLRLTHIPYKGIAQGITDTLSGQVNLVMGDQSSLMQHIKTGKLNAVAMTGNVRSALLPDVPTVAETILPGFDVQAWQGIYGPSGMDADTTAKINAAFEKALKHPETAERLKTSGVDPAGGSADRFTKFTKAEHDRWVGAASKAGITPQ